MPVGFRLFRKVIRVVMRLALRVATVFGVLVFVLCMLAALLSPSRHVDPKVARTIRSAAAAGRLAYRLTEPNEMIRLLGQPTAQARSDSEGSQKLWLEWPGVGATFVKTQDAGAPTLRWLKLGGLNVSVGDVGSTLWPTVVDIGRGRPVALRNTDDLRKFDSFFGFQDVSLARLDLREYRDLLLAIPFDSRTRWPGKDRLPDGFDPNALLEQGKNPGLGVRQLHAQGIDGRGVGIAIVDHPLLTHHVEYAQQLRQYNKIGAVAKFASAQMHGPAVASIAVGKDCGVAPRASLYHFAFMPVSMPDNREYCRIVDKILQMSGSLPASEKTRVISISYGMFSVRPNYDQWLETVNRAKQRGILIMTCDAAFLDYGTLARVPGKDPDDPSNYQMGRYSPPQPVLLVPAGGRTIASEAGPTAYKYDPVGGMSWAAPYLAGLAAMAFQLDPDIDPDTIVKLLLDTAIKTDVGRIVNPRGFIEAVKGQARAASLP
jgi:serine protease AprX